jgi:hypothetical protein
MFVNSEKYGHFELSVVVHTYNPSTQEDEAGGWSVQGQPSEF